MWWRPSLLLAFMVSASKWPIRRSGPVHIPFDCLNQVGGLILASPTYLGSLYARLHYCVEIWSGLWGDTLSSHTSTCVTSICSVGAVLYLGPNNDRIPRGEAVFPDGSGGWYQLTPISLGLGGGSTSSKPLINPKKGDRERGGLFTSGHTLIHQWGITQL